MHAPWVAGRQHGQLEAGRCPEHQRVRADREHVGTSVQRNHLVESARSVRVSAQPHRLHARTGGNEADRGRQFERSVADLQGQRVAGQLHGPAVPCACGPRVAALEHRDELPVGDQGSPAVREAVAFRLPALFQAFEKARIRFIEPQMRPAGAVVGEHGQVRWPVEGREQVLLRVVLRDGQPRYAQRHDCRCQPCESPVRRPSHVVPLHARQARMPAGQAECTTYAAAVGIRVSASDAPRPGPSPTARLLAHPDRAPRSLAGLPLPRRIRRIP